jgi:predicted NUDIX family phosphoesterase
MVSFFRKMVSDRLQFVDVVSDQPVDRVRVRQGVVAHGTCKAASVSAGQTDSYVLLAVSQTEKWRIVFEMWWKITNHRLKSLGIFLNQTYKLASCSCCGGLLDFS